MRRKSHAAFRAAWIEAIAIAYRRLELVLLDRALNGTEKLVTHKDGREERMVHYSNQVALTLFKMHRETAIPAPTGGSTADVEARAAIGAILAALRSHGLILS